MARVARRWAAILFVVLLLAFFIPPLINGKRFKDRIVGTMSDSLGRRVEVGEITLRLLPRPGFDLQNVVVHDDASFSAEPMLRADQVTAYIRLSSLWRGRMEIARLALDYPSLNLVRTEQGKWNLAAVLTRTASIPSAPTAQRSAEERPRFPYIEADAGRINFKFGNEKKVFTLSEADFALWLESEKEWGMRLEARPVRTDMQVADVGTLRIEGSFHPAAEARDTRLKFNYELERAQLGQVTSLIYGRDRGWRGTLNVRGAVNGTPAEASATLTATLDDFRRYDIFSRDTMHAALQCSARYTASQHSLHAIDCRLPVGDGEITAKGRVDDLFASRAYDVLVTLDRVPMNRAVALARRAKRDLPEDLSASGTIQGTASLFTGKKSSLPQWEGRGTASNVVFSSSRLARNLSVGTIPFLLVPEYLSRNPKGLKPGSILAVGPFSLDLDGAAPVRATGAFSAREYRMDFVGDSELGRTLRVARALGLDAPRADTSGKAKLNIVVGGEWSGFTRPVPTGTVQVREVETLLPGINAPLNIPTADITLNRDNIDVRRLQAALAETKIRAAGSVRIQRCEAAPCPATVALRSPELSITEVESLLRPERKRSWFDFGSDDGASPAWLQKLDVSGSIAVERLAAADLTANRVQASVRIDGGRAALTNIQAEVFGGAHKGEWQADFLQAKPVYTGTGTVQHLAVGRAAALLRPTLASGTATVTYRLSMQGFTAQELAQTTSGSADFAWGNGSVQSASLDGRGAALRFSLLNGRAVIRNGTFEFQDTVLTSTAGTYEVDGTATVAGTINLDLQSVSAGAVLTSPAPQQLPGVKITGTFESPRVEPAPATRASLQ